MSIRTRIIALFFTIFMAWFFWMLNTTYSAELITENTVLIAIVVGLLVGVSGLSIFLFLEFRPGKKL